MVSDVSVGLWWVGPREELHRSEVTKSCVRATESSMGGTLVGSNVPVGSRSSKV